MGIRFACHVCGKQLNIKLDLAGRRGVCPSCSSKFRIPLQDSDRSTPVEMPLTRSEQTAQTPVHVTPAVHGSPNGGVDTAGQSIASGQSVSTGVEDGAAAGIVDEIQEVAPSASGIPSREAGSKEMIGENASVSERPAANRSLLDDDPEATWYVRPPSGGQYGPASSDILRKWIDEGRVAASALLWREGWPQWRDASEALPELAGQFPKNDTSNEASNDTSSTASTSSPSRSAMVDTGAVESRSPEFSGESGVGASRRSRSIRRVLMIGILTAIAATLIGVLVVVINRS